MLNELLGLSEFWSENEIGNKNGMEGTITYALREIHHNNLYVP